MKKLLIVISIISLMILSGCATSVGDITQNPEKYYGKKVLVSGEVSAPLNFGQMKGFTLRQGDTSILVSSEVVPDYGDTVTVRGTVVKGILTSAYVFADKVAIQETRQEKESKKE